MNVIRDMNRILDSESEIRAMRVMNQCFRSESWIRLSNQNHKLVMKAVNQSVES